MGFVYTEAEKQCLKWFEKAGGGSLSPLTSFPYPIPQSTTPLPPELGG